MTSTAPHPRLRFSSSTRVRALLLALVVAVLIFVASQDRLHAALLRLLATVQTVIAEHPVVGALLFVALAAVSAMLAFVSSAALVPVAVYVWGATVCALLLWTGWIVGGLCAYAIGRTFGQGVVVRLTSRGTLARYQDRITKRTPFTFVLLFQLALPSEIPGYVLGMADYPVRRYVVALAAAELPYVIGTVFLGEGLLRRQFPLLLAVGAASVILGLLAWRAFASRLQANQASDL